MIPLDAIQLIHEAIADGVEASRQGDDATSGDRWKEAANLALVASGVDGEVNDKQEAVQVLQALEKNLAEQGKFIEVAVLLWGNGMFDSRPSVVREVFKAVQENSKLIILGGSSLSKCLAVGTKVIMYDGSMKKVEDVVSGDVLMGDDSSPRNVLSTGRGSGQLYRIVPSHGPSWVCNDEHIITMKCRIDKKNGNGTISSYRYKGNVMDFPIKEWMGKSPSFRKEWCQFHVGVEFGERPIEVDPYIYGLWIADGGVGVPVMHKPDGGQSRAWCEYFESNGMAIRRQDGPTCPAWFVKKPEGGPGENWFTTFIRKSYWDGEKRILEDYRINSRENRLRLLAGLIDGDGTVATNGGAFSYTTKYDGLADDIVFLARSCGFYANSRKQETTATNFDFTGIYNQIYIGGDVAEIPTKVKKIRHNQDEPLGRTIEVEDAGIGEWAGFEIDGNRRFLLEDFTVTHNTFSCGVYFYLQWRMDSYWTAVKLAAPSEDHLYTNLFSHLVALHKGAVIPMTDNDAENVKVNETDLFISMKDALPEMRIQGVLCKQSQISAGALRGHKPKPYRKPAHPKYGNSTRLLILIDEGTQVSPGAFQDIATTEASIDPGMDNVKIVMPCNPEGITYKIVQMAEPEEGWDPEQVDTLYSWVSKQGYPVLRLDGKRFENVVERRTIYPRMLTYEAFLGFLRAGEHSAAYWAKGRGFPPLKDNAYTIIPPSWVQSQRGEPIYVGKVDNIAALDTALSGGDKAILGIGRWGEAAGWTHMNGETEWFVNRADPTQKINKHVMVVDQLFQLPKTSSATEMVQELMGRCNGMGIPPENVVLDKGGNAAGVWSHARTFWGDVLGIENGVKASDERVLSDDQMTAYDTYNLKATELWFAFKRWLDPVVCAILIHPIIPSSPLFTQLTTRRYYNVKGGKVQVEAKEIYRARNQGHSPDEADVCLLLCEWCRQRGKVLPGIMEKNKDDTPGDTVRVSLQNADEQEPLGTQGEWQPNRLDAE